MKLILMMAITADGRIGRSADHFPDWTGSADKRLFAQASHRAGVVIMGARTYDTLGKPLAGRHNIVLTRNPRHRASAANLEFTSQTPQQILAGLSSRGVAEAILAGGAQINTLFATAGLIDELRVTVAPLIFGAGPGLFDAPVELNLDLIETVVLDDGAVSLHYRVMPVG